MAWFNMPLLFPSHQIANNTVGFFESVGGDEQVLISTMTDSTNKTIFFVKNKIIHAKRPQINQRSRFMDSTYIIGFAEISYSSYYHTHIPDYISLIETPPPRYTA